MSKPTFYYVDRIDGAGVTTVLLNLNYVKEIYAALVDAVQDQYKIVYVLKDNSFRYSLDLYNGSEEAANEIQESFME